MDRLREEAGAVHKWQEIPEDAAGVRQRRFVNGEELVAPWHRTMYWIRREGVVEGVITACERVYHPNEVELLGSARPWTDHTRQVPPEWDPKCTKCWEAYT
jgi:hypothetical protein